MDVRLGPNLPLSQLLDSIEERLDAIVGSLGNKLEIDDAAARIPAILRRVKIARNCYAPFNQLPSEIVALIASFFAKERDLINATAVCQHWRKTLLSLPLLWSNAGGSSLEIQAYLERSKSAPLDIDLSDSSLIPLIRPHTSRIIGLTLQLTKRSSFDGFVACLDSPISTLRTFRISVGPRRGGKLEFPSMLENPFFLHAKTLEIRGASFFRGSVTFPHVTELILHMDCRGDMGSFLKIFGQLPLLEKLHITVLDHLFSDGEISPVFTLPHVQTMSLSIQNDHTAVYCPRILARLILPNLILLRIKVSHRVIGSSFLFPEASFSDHLPNLAELPELQVNMGNSSGEATFRSASGATLEYLARPFHNHWHVEEGKIWENLPLHTVRRLIVNMESWTVKEHIYKWFVGLLVALERLEHLELGGRCGNAIRWLCHKLRGEPTSIHIQTLTIHCEEDVVRLRALELKRLAGAAGVAVTIYNSNPEREEREARTDPGGSDIDDEWRSVLGGDVQWLSNLE